MKKWKNKKYVDYSSSIYFLPPREVIVKHDKMKMIISYLALAILFAGVAYWAYLCFWDQSHAEEKHPNKDQSNEVKSLFDKVADKEANGEVYEINGMSYTMNRFGDIFPIWQNIPENQLTEKLLAFIDVFKEKSSPIIIEIPHENSPILNALIKSNFTFRSGDQNKSEWIVKNR